MTDADFVELRRRWHRACLADAKALRRRGGAPRDWIRRIVFEHIDAYDATLALIYAADLDGDLTVERAMLRPEWDGLFSAGDRAMARYRIGRAA